MSEDKTTAGQRQTCQMFALAAASTQGCTAYDNVAVYPKLVSPTNLNRTSKPSAFNSSNLADAVNKLVTRPPFNVPAAGIMGILGTRTVANQGFAA